MGQIYFRQEKYEMAEYHFRRSLLINQRSSVLRCYVGVALHKIGRAADALEQLQVHPISWLFFSSLYFICNENIFYIFKIIFYFFCLVPASCSDRVCVYGKVVCQVYVCKAPFCDNGCSGCARADAGAAHLVRCCMESSLRSVCN